jgi:putative chitinase
MLELQHLISAGIEPTQARRFLEPLLGACERFRINTPRRMGAFLGQCAHESNGFTRLEENLFYTTPERVRFVFQQTVPTMAMASTLLRNPKALASHVYARKNGNGDTASGDGWTYRARGLIGITGLNNYRAAEQGIGRPYVAHPDLIADPYDAALTSAHWWHDNGCNKLADDWDIDGCTRRVNGPGMQGRSHRAGLSQDFLETFS